MLVQRDQHLVLVRPDAQRRQSHPVIICFARGLNNTTICAVGCQQRAQGGPHPRDQLPEQADKLQRLGAAGPSAAHREPVRIDAHAVQNAALLSDQLEAGVRVALALLGEGGAMEGLIAIIEYRDVSSNARDWWLWGNLVTNTIGYSNGCCGRKCNLWTSAESPNGSAMSKQRRPSDARNCRCGVHM